MFTILAANFFQELLERYVSDDLQSEEAKTKELAGR